MHEQFLGNRQITLNYAFKKKSDSEETGSAPGARSERHGSRAERMLAASNPLALMRAMTMHASQFVWYRRLFVVFSRYWYTNTLKCLKG